MQPHRENERKTEQRNRGGGRPTLDWRNRDEATRAAAGTPLHILREVPEMGVGGASENLLVHGDNLAALKALLPFAAGQVKCIYIDPPYNTGSAFEHYDDNLEHSTWLSLLYPRLQLLREFLSEDGSIWISIDDREGAYLQVICDEIFGRPNFVSNISWQRNYSIKGDSKGIVTSAEHIVVYSKREGWSPNKLPRSAGMDRKYKNPDNDPQGAWRSDNPYASDGATHQGMVYAIQHPFTGELLYPSASSHWRYRQEEMLSHMNGWARYELKDLGDAEKRAEVCGVAESSVRLGVKGIVLAESLADAQKHAYEVLANGPWPKFFFSKNGKGGIARKTYLSAVGEVAPSNLWLHEDVGHTDEAKKEVLKLFDGKSPFATPKPERLVKRILEIATNPGDLVLDSFLGSGTTAAVAHKMGRRWIGVELGEHARTHCAVRLRKVIEGEQGGISKAVGWKGGGSFRFLELGEELLDGNGAIRESIPWEVLAAHVWWKETKTGWGVAAAARPEGSIHRKSPVLGVRGGVAYALLYNGILKDRRVDGGNVLTKRTLALVREDLGSASFDSLVVYAEWSKLGAEALAAERIVLKQTPYDLDIRK